MVKFGPQIEVSFRFSVPTGPRSEAAGVSLGLYVYDSYEFVNAAEWPAEWPGADYSRAVERGVRDGLRECGFDPDLGVRVVLEAVEFDPVNSDERSFYIAAKCAALSRGMVSRERERARYESHNS